MTSKSKDKGSAPPHHGFIVEKYGEGKSYWTRVASVWQHEDGLGCTVKIKPGLAVTGELVIRPVKERAEDAPDEA